MHYDHDSNTGNPITGWGHVAMIDDLSFLMPDPIPRMAADLKNTWQTNWQRPGNDQTSEVKITRAITDMRTVMKARLKTIR